MVCFFFLFCILCMIDDSAICTRKAEELNILKKSYGLEFLTILMLMD